MQESDKVNDSLSESGPCSPTRLFLLNAESLSETLPLITVERVQCLNREISHVKINGFICFQRRVQVSQEQMSGLLVITRERVRDNLIDGIGRGIPPRVPVVVVCVPVAVPVRVPVVVCPAVLPVVACPVVAVWPGVVV